MSLAERRSPADIFRGSERFDIHQWHDAFDEAGPEFREKVSKIAMETELHRDDIVHFLAHLGIDPREPRTKRTPGQAA